MRRNANFAYESRGTDDKPTLTMTSKRGASRHSTLLEVRKREPQISTPGWNPGGHWLKTTRREKTRKAVRQATASTDCNPNGCKSLGRFDEPRSDDCEEARVVRSSESEH